MLFGKLVQKCAVEDYLRKVIAHVHLAFDALCLYTVVQRRKDPERAIQPNCEIETRLLATWRH